MILVRILAAMLVAVLPMVSQAATITFTDSEALPSNGEELTVSKFDPSLGTLTGAQLVLGGSVNARILYRSPLCEQTAGCTNKFTAELGLLVGSADLGGTIASPSQSSSIFCSTPYNVGCAVAITRTATLSETLDLFGQPALLGSGFLTFYFIPTVVPFGGDVISRGQSNFSISMTYTYTPATAAVPLPASLPLLAAGMGGLALLARRRRA